jgi:hypothetical protein
VRTRIHNRTRRSERGYALLLVAFAATLMLIVAMEAARGQAYGKREQEQEMIWRGQQYVRGIKMYYRKTGKYPTSLEDLMKPQMGDIHFMRQAYKDPMNKEDGSWRLLYVGPNGQLIGSLKPPPPFSAPTGIPGTGAVGAPVGGLNGIGTQGTPGLTGTSGGFGSMQPSGPVTGQGAGATSTDTDASGNPAQYTPTGPTTIVGGNIVGVGSKVDGKSVMVYETATNYHLFEFYWDQSKDAAGFGPQPNIPGTSTPGTPAGTQPGTTGNPGIMNPPGGTNPTPPLSNPPQN